MAPNAIPATPKPKTVGTAFLWWFASMCGVLGFHRFYLRFHATGTVWVLTGGCLVVGAISDAFRLRSLVDKANQATYTTHALRAQREAFAAANVRQMAVGRDSGVRSLVRPDNRLR